MTREEAIDIIKCLAWHTRPNEEDIEQAINALSAEPCDDAITISRQVAVDVIADTVVDGESLGYSLADEIVSKIPPVTPKQTDVLDKIRAEIKQKIVKRPWLDFEDRERDRNDAFLEALDVIDKYMAESEEQICQT